MWTPLTYSSHPLFKRGKNERELENERFKVCNRWSHQGSLGKLYSSHICFIGTPVKSFYAGTMALPCHGNIVPCCFVTWHSWSYYLIISFLNCVCIFGFGLVWFDLFFGQIQWCSGLSPCFVVGLRNHVGHWESSTSWLLAKKMP